MKAFIYFSRRSQQDRAARRVVWLTTAAPPRRIAAVLAVAAATLCKRQKTSPLLFKSSTKSVFHCCYRWAASYLPLPAAGDRRAAATAVGFQSQMSAAAATKLLHNLLEKKAMILATKRSTIEVLGGKQRLALDRLWYSSSLSVEETFWKSLWQWQHDVLPSPPFSEPSLGFQIWVGSIVIEFAISLSVFFLNEPPNSSVVEELKAPQPSLFRRLFC